LLFVLILKTLVALVVVLALVVEATTVVVIVVSASVTTSTSNSSVVFQINQSSTRIAYSLHNPSKLLLQWTFAWRFLLGVGVTGA
jgi:cell division protein YceG involved in septum cleavage